MHLEGLHFNVLLFQHGLEQTAPDLQLAMPRAVLCRSTLAASPDAFGKPPDPLEHALIATSES